MVMIQALKKLSYILSISLVVYIIYPIINGFGCNFNAEAENDSDKIYMECFAGVANITILSKKNLHITTINGIWWKRGSHIWMFIKNKKENQGDNVAPPVEEVESKQQKTKMWEPLSEKNFLEFFFFTGNIREGSNGVIVGAHPVMMIYPAIKKGNLSWFD